MKRRNIENFFTAIWTDMKVYVQTYPVQGFFIGLAAGFLLAILRGFLVPLVAIIALIAVVLWLMAEQDDDGFTSSTTYDAEIPPRATPQYTPPVGDPVAGGPLSGGPVSGAGISDTGVPPINPGDRTGTTGDPT